MGRMIEERISAVVSGGPDSIQNHLVDNGALEFFVWMGLIFLKLHLKNKASRKCLDMRVPSGMISDDYEWDLLHHIHTVVRCFYIPTVLVLPCRPEGSCDHFDFCELHLAQL
jgi:hypothetical protein